MANANKQSEYYRNNEYVVDEHDKVFNQFSQGIGFSVFYIKHLFQGPFFLVEIGDDFSEAGTREEAVTKLIKLLRDKKRD